MHIAFLSTIVSVACGQSGGQVFSNQASINMFSFRRLFRLLAEYIRGMDYYVKNTKSRPKKSEQTKTTITTSQGNLLIDLLH